MTELKSKFISLMEIGLVEFSINHPGTKIAASIMEEALKVEEEELQTAMEQNEKMSKAVDDFIKYQFTHGKNVNFKKPDWLN